MKKAIKVILTVISFGFIALSGIEIISGLVGDISLFGFNLTVAQQKVTHYITSGGFAVLGGSGFLVNEFLNKKLREAREITNTVLEKFLEIRAEYERINKEIEKVRTELPNKVQELKNEIYTQKVETQELVKLVRVDLETKLSNPLIDKHAKELIERALGVDNEQEQEE